MRSTGYIKIAKHKAIYVLKEVVMSKEKKISIIIIASIILILFPVIVFAAGAVSYTVSFDSMGGSSVGGTEVQAGMGLARPADPSFPGHALAGWYKEEDCINEWNFETDIVTADITLYAAWKDIYTISASAADPSAGDVSGGGDYASGAPVTLYATPKEGYRFLRWAGSGSPDPVVSLVASVNADFIAEFAPIDTPSLSTASSGYNSVILNWTPVDQASGYEVYRSDKQDGDYSLMYTDPSDRLSRIDHGVETGRKYYYKVRAFCACETALTYGDFAGPAAAAAEIPAPVVSAVFGGYKSVRFSWEYIPGASGYEVYRSTSQGGSYLRVCDLKYPEASSYTGYGLITDKVYYYRVRAYRKIYGETYYSDYSAIQTIKASFTAPALKAVSASRSSIRLTWSALPGVSGYELYKSTSPNGRYKKIYTSTSAPCVIFTDKGLKRGVKYYYKIRAYGMLKSKKVYSGYSQTAFAFPSSVIAEPIFTILYQSDPQWGLPDEVRHKACLMCSYSITINNMGIDTNPKTFYETNGYTTYVSPEGLAENYGVKAVCATDFCSPYLERYEGFETYIKDPSANAIAAIQEALNKHPEGVICYFRRGTSAHAIVACRYKGNTIYYSDPGRSRKSLLTFNYTWVWYHHRMNYGNLAFMVTLDKITE